MTGNSVLHHVTLPGRKGLPAVILLHGSGQTEEFLVPLARAVSRDHPIIAVRGRVEWEGGYAHFRRRPDRTLDEEDLATGAAALCGLLRHLRDAGEGAPVLLGYSNGAIVAAAAVVHEPGLTSGAILLRPLSPAPHQVFPSLDGYPVLLVAGENDDRRAAADDTLLAEQFRAAGACVTASRHPGGHSPSMADVILMRDWLVSVRWRPRFWWCSSDPRFDYCVQNQGSRASI